MSAPLHYQYLADFTASTGSIEGDEDGAYHTPEARGGGREPQGVACDHVPSPALPSDTHSRARKPHQMRRPNPCPQKESLIKPTYLLPGFELSCSSCRSLPDHMAQHTEHPPLGKTKSSAERGAEGWRLWVSGPRSGDRGERASTTHTSSSHPIRYPLRNVLLAHPWARDADWLARIAAHRRWAMPRWWTRGRRSEIS